LRLPVDVREAMDVWIFGGFGGFVLGRGVFIWHVVQFQVDVLFFKGLKGIVNWGDIKRSAV